MKKVFINSLLITVCFASCLGVFAQSIDPWKLTAVNPSRDNYYGITVANGMIGIVGIKIKSDYSLFPDYLEIEILPLTV